MATRYCDSKLLSGFLEERMNYSVLILEKNYVLVMYVALISCRMNNYERDIIV
jgi:hypothetical protein